MYVCLQSLESESESDGDEVGDVHVDPSTSSYCNENILHQCCSSKATCIHLKKKTKYSVRSTYSFPVVHSSEQQANRKN